MNLWRDCVLTGIYTLSPTHCGTGQTTGAVDLPIARDAATGFPILPATSLKGVARDYCKGSDAGLTKEQLTHLFGPSVDDEPDSTSLKAGQLVFTEGRLLAYPIRSLNRPYLHVTCPMILRRLTRDLRALEIDFLEGISLEPLASLEQAQVADGALAGQPLILEDLVYEGGGVTEMSGLDTLGQRLGELLPEAEHETRDTLRQSLVVIPDEDFADLMQRVVPVQARIKLTSHKTTAQVDNEKGNLWYEEHLPADCLFLALIGERQQRAAASDNRSGNGESNHDDQSAVTALRGVRERLATVQIGGNETVGHGFCLWTFWSGTQR